VKKILLGSLLTILVLNSAIFAKRKFDFVIEPNLIFGDGYSKYVYEETGFLDNAATVVGHVKSELKFPLDRQCVGLTFGLRSMPNAKTDWSVMTSYAVGVNDPKGKMYDSDWISWPHEFDGLFSYTESDVKQSSRLFSVEGRFSLQKGKLITLGLVGGCRFQKISQDIVNLDGWQVDPSTGGDSVYTFAMTGEVGYYSVTWKTALGGLYLDVRPIRPFKVDMVAAFAPTWVYDKDIHILRNREGWASGAGRGFIGRLTAEYSPGDSRKKACLIAGLSADWYSCSVKGTQTLYWYGDDPISPDYYDTGNTYAGIPHQMTTEQFNLTLRLGVRF
jgi:hypothetical protein